MTRGLFIGRFQPFHNGHLKDVRDALREVGELVIGIGSSNESRTKENPFTAAERKEMIAQTLRQQGIPMISIYNVPDIGDDALWVAHVIGIVGDIDRVYTGNQHTRVLFEEKGIAVKQVDFLKGVEGTIVRDAIADKRPRKHLVPKGTLGVMQRIGGEAIIHNSLS